MGFGLPAAIGASVGQPGKMVILVTGDGSIQMTMQELGTMREQGLPLKIVILNNRSLGMVRQLQQFYCEGRYFAVDFGFHPDFMQLAKAYGIPGFEVKTEADVVRTLPQALLEPGPALVECLIPPEENVMPMVLAGTGIDEAIDH
jgi:acetolactate synthase-1/2/3 large subunit